MWGRTSVCDLAGVAARALVSKGWEGGADLAQALKCSSIADALIPSQGNFAYLSGLGVLDLGLDWDDLIVEPACFLGPLSSLV